MAPDQANARTELILARQAREDAEPRWRRSVVDALRAGLGAPEVARLAGCTRQRVYQIQYEEKNLLDSRGRPR